MLLQGSRILIGTQDWSKYLTAGIVVLVILMCILFRKIRGFFRRNIRISFIITKQKRKKYESRLYKDCPSSPKECIICLCDFQAQESVSTMECSHVCHEDCLNQWTLKNESCPLCRMDLNEPASCNLIQVRNQ